MNDRSLSDRDFVARPLQVHPAPLPAALMQPQLGSEGETLDLVEYWRSITKRKWSIVGLVLLVCLITTLIVFSMWSTYRATTTVLIEQGKSKVVSIEEVYNSMGGNREYYQTQVEILKSRELARKVVERLKLTTHRDYDPRQREAGVRDYLSPTAWFTVKAPPTDDDILKTVIKEVSDDLQVQPVRNSQLVQISFSSYDKELSAKLPNTLAEVFIESDLDARVAMTQKAGSWLTERMSDLRVKLDASERALQDYRERERIVDVKGVAMSGASKALEQATTDLVNVRTKRAEAESLFNQVRSARGRPGGYESISAVLRHPTVQKLKELEAETERKLADASKRYGPEHPRMVQANAELASARENVKRQIESVVVGVEKEYEVARSNEQALERALGQSKFEIQGINRKEFQLGVLEREAQGNKQLYDMFVTRFKETNVAGDLQSTVARVVDPANVPNIAYAPKKVQIVSIAAAVALLIGVMLSLLLDRISNTINTAAEIETRLGLPMLGYLQKMAGFGKKNMHSELAFINDSTSLFSESIRTIRTSVLMSALDSAKKVIVVTSSVPSEGKTTVCFNLACALAQVNKSVLLIDGDLRRPKIGRLVGRAKGAPGLSNMVSGVAPISDCLIKHEKGGFHVLTAGFVPPNPLELLSSAKFADVMDKLKEVFDVILIDSPPVGLVSDSLVLTQVANEVIYVVKADSTPYQLARAGIRRLAMAQAPVLGVVLNQLDLERAEKYYGEYSGYGRYGDYKAYAYGQSPKDKTADA